MNSKERVCNAVRQRPSDRVPTLYGDVSWISFSNTRTSRPEGGFIDEWGVVNIPRDGMCHGERLHPVTTIAGLVAHPFPDPLRPERWDGVRERIAAARESWTMVVLGPAIWEQIHFLCPMEDAMAWLYEYPEEMGAVADRLVLLEATGAGLGGMIADNYGHWPAGIPPTNIVAWQETVAAYAIGAQA